MKPSIIVAAAACYACVSLAGATPFAPKLNGVVSHQAENNWLLNKQPLRSAPGLIVYGKDNHIIGPGQWPKAAVKAQYQLDLYGQLWRVWVVSQ